MKYPSKISDRVIWLREYHRLDQAQFSYAVGMDKPAVRNLETTSSPLVKTLLRLQGFYEELNLHWLLTGEGVPFFKEPERIQVDMPEPKKRGGRRKSAFTEEHDQMIRDAWPDIAVIEGFYPHQIKNRARSVLRLTLTDEQRIKRQQERNRKSKINLSADNFKETDIEAYNEKNREWLDSEMLPSQADPKTTFTPEQDQQIIKAWPNYRSVTLPHKSAAQVYQRGIRLGLPKLSDMKAVS